MKPFYLGKSWQSYSKDKMVDVCQFYAIMRLPHISLIAAFLAYFGKVRITRIFSAWIDISTAILVLFVFLLRLPISTGFRYFDHLVANRMAPSMCPADPCGTRWGSWFQAILCRISAYFRRIFGDYAIRTKPFIFYFSLMIDAYETTT